MIVDPYYPYYLQIGLIDLILIALVEIAFIWFFFPKEMMSKVVFMIGAINLIKMGVMILIVPIIPSIANTVNQMLLIEVTIMFLIGTIISTLIYENELWAPTREKAGDLAFRITAISSLVWVTYRSLNSSFHYDVRNFDLMRTLVPESIQFMNINPTKSLNIPLDSFGLLILIIGIVILYIRLKGHLFKDISS